MTGAEGADLEAEKQRLTIPSGSPAATALATVSMPGNSRFMACNKSASLSLGPWPAGRAATATSAHMTHAQIESNIVKIRNGILCLLNLNLGTRVCYSEALSMTTGSANRVGNHRPIYSIPIHGP